MTRRRFQGGPFAPLAAQLRAGRVPVARIVDAWCGAGPRGQEWQRDVLYLLRRVRVDDETVADDVQAGGEDRPCARALLLLMLELAGSMRRHGRAIQVRGPDGFWGRQHEQVQLPPELVEHRRIDKAHDLELAGLSPDAAWAEACQLVLPSERVPVPKERAGGNAARIGKSVRTVGRYAHVAREARLIGCRQPPAPGTRKNGGETEQPVDGAVMPRNGKWSYPVWRFLREPPETMLRALRLWWGELEPEDRQGARRPVTHGLRKPPSTLTAPRGPPLDLADIATAHPDLDVFEDADVLALAALKQRIGTRSNEL